MSQPIVIVGGGIAGLATALACKDLGHELVIVERDPAPPELSPDQAFEHWERPGVPQFRHAHILLARLQSIVRDDYPELHAELLAAGIELSALDEVLPASHLGTFEPQPEDRDLLHLWGRRPTFEYIVRRFVGRLLHVRFIHSTRVEGLVTEVRGEPDARTVHVQGVELLHADDRRETLPAALVIDASGKRTKLPEQLIAAGVKIESTRFESDRVYVCRHYRLRDPSREPKRCGTGANLEYFGYATFYAEHGHFAISLSCPVEETGFAQLMKRADGFDAVCERIDALSDWIKQSEPTTKVLGAGGFANRWTTFAAPGGAALTGFFAVGDSHIETNPMYGRGCASAFVQAKVLAKVLAETDDPHARPARYYTNTRAQMQVHFDFCVQTDNVFRSGGKHSRGEPLPVGERVLRYLYEHAWMPALERSPLVAREMIKAMQMREVSGASVRLRMVAEILVAWVGSWFQRGKRPVALLGPTRAELMRSLPVGISKEPEASPEVAQLGQQQEPT